MYTLRIVRISSREIALGCWRLIISFPPCALCVSDTTFQGGSVVDVFGANGSNPTGNWKIVGAVQRVFDKSVKGYVFRCDGGPTAKMQMPKDERKALGLVQPYIVFQINVLCTILGRSFCYSFSICLCFPRRTGTCIKNLLDGAFNLRPCCIYFTNTLLVIMHAYKCTTNAARHCRRTVRKAHLILHPTDATRARRRLIFSTAFREVVSTPLHTRVTVLKLLCSSRSLVIPAVAC